MSGEHRKEDRIPVEEFESILHEYLIKAERMITDCGNQELLRELQRINTMNSDAGYSLAVTGEIARGKSTLINKMLCEDIIPVSYMPTTLMITKVSYGDKRDLELLHSDGRIDSLGFENNVWEKAYKMEPQGMLHLLLENGWLKNTGIHIIDTCGAGDLDEARMDKVSRVIASCNGVLIVVKATAPLTLTERAFIEEHVLSRKMPNAAVVLTRMDLVPGHERPRVMEHVKNKLKAWGYNIPVVCANDGVFEQGSGYVEAVGISSIREMIEAWAGNEDMQYMRKVQVGYQLYGLMALLREILKIGIGIQNLTVEERQNAANLAEEAFESKKIQWEDIVIEAGRREHSCWRSIEKALYDKKNGIAMSLQMELEHSSNPKVWWQNELPFYLKREISGIYMHMEDDIQDCIGRDIDWLQKEVGREYGVSKINSVTYTDIDGAIMEPIIKPAPDEIKDLNKVRLLTRIAFGTASILTYLLYSPLTVVLSTGGGILTDKILNDKIKKQKEVLVPAIEDIIDGVLARMCVLIRQNLHEIYNQIVKDVKEQERIWTDTQYKILTREKENVNVKITGLEFNIKQVEEFNRHLYRFIKEG